MSDEVKDSIRKITREWTVTETALFIIILVIGATVFSTAVWYLILSFFGWIFNFEVTILQSFGVMIMYSLFNSLIKR